MENPRKRTTVAMAADGDGLHVFNHQQQQAYALNTTSALVWQHCDGQTPPEQLTELVRQKFNVSRAEGEQLTWLALDELGKANLLEAEAPPTTDTEKPMTYFVKVTDFINSLIEIPARPIRGHGIHNTTTDSKYLAGIANIYISGDDQNSVGRCS